MENHNQQGTSAYHKKFKCSGMRMGEDEIENSLVHGTRDKKWTEGWLGTIV